MKNKKLIVIAFALVFALALAALPNGNTVYANSAQTSWYGTTANGMQVVGGSCPLEVKHEKLTFRINEFPRNYYQTAEEVAAYDSSVTAEYTFFNPADYDVTANLAFPFGTRPDYLNYDFGDVDTDKHDITVDGKAVDKTLRHTWSPYEFKADVDVPKLRNDYTADSFFGTDLMVTEYVYEFKNIPKDEDKAPYASFPLPFGVNTRISLSECNGGRLTDGVRYNGLWVKNGERVSVYAVGVIPDVPPVWTVYEDGSEEKATEGTAELVETKSTSFLELVTAKYDEKYGVSKVDWYNAAIDKINSEISNGNSGYFTLPGDFREGHDLMRWYCYELKVPAGAEVVNAVTAPVYPAIDGGYEPPVYSYEYLSSPAKSWAKFGSLEIIIETPYKMLDSGDLAFYTSDTGFTLSRKGLPDGEIRFTLCSVDNPKRNVKYGWLIFFIVVIAVGGVLCAGAVTAAVVMIVKTKRRLNATQSDANKKEDTQTQDENTQDKEDKENNQ